MLAARVETLPITVLGMAAGPLAALALGRVYGASWHQQLR